MTEHAKTEVGRLLKTLPDECTLEDIQYHIHVLQKMKRSEQDTEEGRVYTQEEVEEYFSRSPTTGSSPTASRR